MDQFMPPGQKSALNAAKHWMAQEWPRYFGLKPLAREGFLAPAVFLSGSNNNTSNPMHRRQKHGRRPSCAALCCAWPCSVLHGAVLWHSAVCSMLCFACAVLCFAVLCCAVLCCAVLCCAVLCCAVLSCALLGLAGPCWAVPCRAALRCDALRCAALCCAVPHLSDSFIHHYKAHCRCKCTPLSCLWSLHLADGTLAERVTLGKRRREQWGIQTPRDMQSSSRASSSARQSDEALAFNNGGPDRAAAGPLTGPFGGSGPEERAVGAAEGMMAKWGYTPGQIQIALCKISFPSVAFLIVLTL